VLGGKAARTGLNAHTGDALTETVREAELAPGDNEQVNMNAGGGYGDPLERDPEAVLGDVLDGYVSLQGARDDYGVAIDRSTSSVDLAATAKLRLALRG
jgi:N-methylhydantoinase B